MNNPPPPAEEYAAHYSEPGFWNKLARFAKAAGKGVVEKALYLYYAARSPDVPARTKIAIYSALGYFIFPLDAIPDVLPLVGYSDDLGVLAGALALCAAHITPAVKAQARDRLKALLGS